MESASAPGLASRERPLISVVAILRFTQKRSLRMFRCASTFSAFGAAGGTIRRMWWTDVPMRAIKTLNGRYPMARIIPAHAVIHEWLQALGYVEV
jgi:hypothetical protein